VTKLVLSVFPGIDLLGRAFEENGFCIVRGPDLIYGSDIRDFHVPAGRFDGVVGGSPCQEFSALNRHEPTGYGLEMLDQFKRVVTESEPDWWLLENVPRVPDVKIDGYSWQRFSLDLAWFTDNSRLRHFQFGSKIGTLNPPIGTRRDVKNTAALATDNRSFAELKALQGLPHDFDLDSFTVAGKKKAVGNGVPLPMGRILAELINRDIYKVTDRQSKNVTDQETNNVTCSCGCGRFVYGRAKYAGPACRKRVSRKQKAAE